MADFREPWSDDELDEFDSSISDQPLMGEYSATGGLSQSPEETLINKENIIENAIAHLALASEMANARRLATQILSQGMSTLTRKEGIAMTFFVSGVVPVDEIGELENRQALKMALSRARAKLDQIFNDQIAQMNLGGVYQSLLVDQWALVTRAQGA